MQKTTLIVLMLLTAVTSNAQNNNDRIERTVQKAENTVTKARTIIDVFQPYLLKARQLYGQTKQLVKETKSSAKGLKNNNNNTNYPVADNNPVVSNNNNTNIPPDPAAGYPTSNNNNNSYPIATNSNTAATIPPQYGVYENYNTQQFLPISNDAIINSDGTGNWGNQNNGVYGNCLDVLTGTVLGMGEAEDNPSSVDLIFVAPAEGQNTYVLMTPSFARNNGTATYMTAHTTDGISKWKDISESEVALTKLTLSQFDKIQNNQQISGAVKNAVNYAGYYTSVGNKLEGQVFAVKVEQENRTVYALVAVVKHYGTSGSNGYLKIKVKSQGIDNNGDGFVDPANYIR